MIMSKLAQQIDQTNVSPGSVALFYLGQAGFWFKTSNGKNIVIDLYLSDAAERLFGFKRMSPSVLDPQDLEVDLFLATHSHIDHLDIDILPIVAQKQSVHFVGAPDCLETFQDLGLSEDRFTILHRGESVLLHGISIRGIDADHGDLAPEALGLLLEFDDIKIYHTGDTAFCPDRICRSLGTTPDVLIAPINGAFGNLNVQEVCRLAEILQPKLLIPCHFWMFLEHVAENGLGDPTVFVREGKDLPSGIQPLLLPPGRSTIFSKWISKDSLSRINSITEGKQ